MNNLRNQNLKNISKFLNLSQKQNFSSKQILNNNSIINRKISQLKSLNLNFFKLQTNSTKVNQKSFNIKNTRNIVLGLGLLLQLYSIKKDNQKQETGLNNGQKSEENNGIIENLLTQIFNENIFNKKFVKCLEDVVLKKVQNFMDSKIYQLKKQWGPQITTYPLIKYNIRGNRYQVDFLVDQRKCDLFSLLAIALDTFERAKESSDFVIKDIKTFKDQGIMTITLQFEEAKGNPKNKLKSQGTIYISGEMTSERPNFKFIFEKSEEFSQVDLKAIANVYEEAIRPQNYRQVSQFKNNENQYVQQGNFSQNEDAVSSQEMDEKEMQEKRQEAYKKLEELGVVIFMPQEHTDMALDWNYLAGYEHQKRDIEDTVLLALRHPEIFDNITKGTRMKQEPNRPKAVLFEGPPGTGKTTSAKIIAQQVEIPLIYMPLESIMSKYYGESEKRFADIWDSCKVIGRSIIFIDEIDAIASSRNESMHEGSKRILSTLLRKIDSFESSSDVLLIAATNRKQDLDSAMLSRIDLSVKFQIPDKNSRKAIFQRYAKQLSDQELEKLADMSNNMSGRNISDICKDAERRWASKIIRKETDQELPNLEQYIDTLKNRKSQNLA